MRIVKIVAGLGNQLFAYAFYKKIKKTCGGDVYVDLGWFDYKNRFAWYPYQLPKLNLHAKSIERSAYCVQELYIKNHEITENEFNKRQISVPVVHLYQESTPYACDELWKYDNAYYMGCFQNIDNIKEVLDDIREEVRFEVEQNDEFLQKKKRIQEDKNSVSVHIRLNDYPDKEDFEEICPLEYYNAAINRMMEINPKACFYIFSNNIELVKNRLHINGTHVYMGEGNRFNGIGDLELMTLCHNNIIPNSTFGWWGAVLNKNENKIVIAPDNFDVRFENVKKEDINLWFDDWIRLR